ncbi:MAG TPA: hypothetical protein VFT04_14775 [Gemmatimonadales bacterium]|nr:hypothetical protein [Gemmatimonadales bacterium]
MAACDSGAPSAPSAAPEAAFDVGGTPAKTTDQIVVRLNTAPDGPQDIGFRLTGLRKADILLDDDSDPRLANMRVLPSLKSGNYLLSVKPLPPTYFLQSITCREFGPVGYTNLASTIDLPSGAVNVNLDSGERLDCTFTVVELN